jgi:hypothetical protein
MALLLCLIWRCWGFCRAKSPTESPHGSSSQGYFSLQAGVSAIRATSAVCSLLNIHRVCRALRDISNVSVPSHHLKQDILGTFCVDVVHSCTRIRLTEFSVGPASRCVCNMVPASRCVCNMAPASRCVCNMAPASRCVCNMAPASRCVCTWLLLADVFVTWLLLADMFVTWLHSVLTIPCYPHISELHAIPVPFRISPLEILERFQSKALRMIVNAPWYVPNTLIRRDLHMSSVKETIRRYSSHYGARPRTHPYHLVVNLIGLPDTRHLPADLPHRFLL